MLQHRDVHLWLEQFRGEKVTRDQINQAFPGNPAKQRTAVEKARFHGVRVYHDYRPRHERQEERNWDHLRDLQREIRRSL